MTLPNRLSALLPDPADWIETALPEPRVAEVMTMTLAGAVTPRFVWPVGACDCSADNRDDAQAAALLQSDVMVTVTSPLSLVQTQGAHRTPNLAIFQKYRACSA